MNHSRAKTPTNLSSNPFQRNDITRASLGGAAANNTSSAGNNYNNTSYQQNVYGMTDQLSGMNLNSDYGGYYPSSQQQQQGAYGQQEYPGGYQPDQGLYNGYPQGAGDYDYTPQGMNNSPR